jgi:hypothetical protein
VCECHLATGAPKSKEGEMLTLRHLAVHTLSQTTLYTGDDRQVEDVIFEVDQLRVQIESELGLHYTKKPVYSELFLDLNTYEDILFIVSPMLFDRYTYDHMITTKAHVQWKEYLHALYDFTVIDLDDPKPYLHCTLHFHEKLPHPDELLESDPCYDIVTEMYGMFKALNTEQERITKNVNIRAQYDNGVTRGLQMIEWTEEERAIQRRLKIYTDIIRWSMN